MKTKEKEELNLLKRFVEKASKIAESFSKKLFIILLILIFSSLMISALVFDLTGGLGFIFYVSSLIAIFPCVLLYFVNSRLKEVSNLPSKFNDIHESIIGFKEKFKDSKTKELFNKISKDEDMTFKEKLYLLIKTGPTLWKIKNAVNDMSQLRNILSVVAIANPGFVWLVGISYITAVLWVSFTIFLSLLWLFLA